MDSRSARLRLTPRDGPYWRKIAKGCFLGYRKGQGNGNWCARYRDLAGKQHYTVLGPADDAMDADGSLVLSFDQVQERARTWFRLQASDGPGNAGGYTVHQCVHDYLDWTRQHRRSYGHLETYAKAFILPRLGAIDTAKLTAKMIRKWHETMASEPPRLRTKLGQEQRHRAEDPDRCRRFNALPTFAWGARGNRE